MRWPLCLIPVMIFTSWAACGQMGEPNPEDINRALSGDQTRGPLPADADLSEPPRATLNFGTHWQELTNGTLYQGGDLSVSVHESRFPTCGTSGEVTLGLRATDGTVTRWTLDEGTPGHSRWGRVALPSSGEYVEAWLASDRGDGCVEYDSAFGANYRFALSPWRPVRVVFGADWSETLQGTLHAGDTLVVDYAWERLPQCRIIYRGFPGWDILVHSRVDGGDVQGQSVVGRPDMYSIERRLAVIPIPLDARHLELWFENTQYPPTCKAWDSDYGRNYHFDVQP